MPTNVTIDSLIGADSTINRTRAGTETDRQSFSFAGVDGQFIVGLGDRGLRFNVSGLLRFGGASQAAAVAALDAKFAAMIAYRTANTVLNIIAGGGARAPFETLMGITGAANSSAWRRLVLAEIAESGPRAFTTGAVRVLVPYEIQFQRVP